MMYSLVRCVAAAGVALLLTAPAARAVSKDDVNRAIEKGVDYLRRIQKEDGRWLYGQTEGDARGDANAGATALAGLALLECEVPPDDASIQKAAADLRLRLINSDYTYALSFGILFFDRLGDPGDVPLIESMAVRLLAGQRSTGGWSYHCPGLPADEARRLETLMKARNELTTGRDAPKRGPQKEGWVQRDPKEVSKEIQDLIARLAKGEGREPARYDPIDRRDDNSNTQLANLALWVAGRYGLPVAGALQKIEQRYRRSQNGDGGWGYYAVPLADAGPSANNSMGSTPSMTCAGLLGLATAHGAARDIAARQNKPQASDPSKDRAIKAGLQALGGYIEQPKGPAGWARVPVLHPGPEGKGFYLLWSIERDAVVYGLETIGGKDWYNWGAEILLKSQWPDGRWVGLYGGGGVDTSFALLFLKRSNLTSDLTGLLRGMRDPGKRELKAGVGDLRRVGQGGAFDGPPGVGQRPGAEAADPEVRRLSARLLEAPADRQPAVLEELRDGKGVAYTDALAAAIPHLEGKIKTQARQALAERLAGMKAVTLRDKLADDDPEVRRAAALACAMKEDRTFVPRLIELLEDAEPTVARAAYAALKSLTGENFGPAAGATPAEQKKAVADWKAWWARQGGK
jgi:hypothetical protein